jgi:hypothetical protein
VGLGGLQPPYNPDFFIKYVFISLKSPLISSFSPKFSLFSPSFVFILDPPLALGYITTLVILRDPLLVYNNRHAWTLYITL